MLRPSDPMTSAEATKLVDTCRSRPTANWWNIELSPSRCAVRSRRVAVVDVRHVEIVRREPVPQNERGRCRSGRSCDADISQPGRIQRQLILRPHPLDEVVVDAVAAPDHGRRHSPCRPRRGAVRSCCGPAIPARDLRCCRRRRSRADRSPDRNSRRDSPHPSAASRSRSGDRGSASADRLRGKSSWTKNEYACWRWCTSWKFDSCTEVAYPSRKSASALPVNILLRNTVSPRVAGTST